MALQGANVDEVDGEGNSPLFLAVQKGNSEVMLLLTKLGADLRKVDSEGRTILHWLAEGNREKCIDALSKSLDKVSNYYAPKNVL